MSSMVEASFDRDVTHELKTGNSAFATYLASHNQLHRLTHFVRQGNIAPAERVQEVMMMFEQTRQNAERIDDVATALRCEMFMDFMPLMLYADTINYAPLQPFEARNVRERFGLHELHTALCSQTARAIETYDELSRIKDPSNKERGSIGNLAGLINEQTFLLLFSSHATLKIHALPAPHYDDALTPDSSMRTDAYLYDNRRERTTPKFAAQIKSKKTSRFYRIPVITGTDMCNGANSAAWKGIKPFQTARTIIRIDQGLITSPSLVPKIDHIKGNILKDIFAIRPDALEGVEVRRHIPSRDNPMVAWMRNRRGMSAD